MIREWLLFAFTILSAVAGAVWFVIRIVRSAVGMVRDAEKRIDDLEHTVYDRRGVNGLVRKVDRLEHDVEKEHDRRDREMEEIRRLLVMRRPMDDI